VITDSFETLVADALFDRLLAEMGDGGTYSDPFYLQIKTAAQTAGEPIPHLSDKEMPLIWCEYVGGMDKGAMIGNSVGMATEIFMVYGQLVLTPEILELETNDHDIFVRRAKANADTWARRIRRLLLGWSPGVICPVTGQKTVKGRPTVYGVAATFVNELRREFTVTLRWELEMEP
jgi:hypothetical protein